MAEPTLLPERLQYRPTKIELDESIEKAKATLLKKIKRSVYVYRVDCGGCNGCEIEIFGSITPVFDVERFGIKVVPSPRHADVLLYTGAVTRAMRMPPCAPLRLHPIPRSWCPTARAAAPAASSTITTASGAARTRFCRSMSISPAARPAPRRPSTALPWRSVCWTKSSMPRPRWRPAGEQADILHPGVPYKLRVAIEREARAMSGYRYGRDLANEFMDTLEGAPKGDIRGAMALLIDKQDDPRRVEVYSALQDLVLAGGR